MTLRVTPAVLALVEKTFYEHKSQGIFENSVHPQSNRGWEKNKNGGKLKGRLVVTIHYRGLFGWTQVDELEMMGTVELKLHHLNQFIQYLTFGYCKMIPG